MGNNANNNLVKYSPSGTCRMGDTEVTYYRTGNRLWFDKKAIEFVLTGKNQNNLLGQYKDPKNHSRIFDEAAHQPVTVISVTGVKNYLKKAWSVGDENRRYFYDGLKSLDKSKQDEVTEPIQLPILENDTKDEKPLILKIIKGSDGYDLEMTFGDMKPEEKKTKLIEILLDVANSVNTGKVVFAE